MPLNYTKGFHSLQVVEKREILLLLAIVINYLLLIGSNLGNRQLLLEQAVESISALSKGQILKSKMYESEPWGFDSGDWFLNQAIIISSDIAPAQMLDVLLEIEKNMGRMRSDSTGYSSRSIDIDILMADDLVISTSELQVPHPRMQERKFVLLPAAEIAGNWVHPVFKTTVFELIKECNDVLKVRAL